MQTLTTLSLLQNEIENEGAQHLADALRNNIVPVILTSPLSCLSSFFTQTLTTLDLGRNEIQGASKQYIMEILENNHWLDVQC